MANANDTSAKAEAAQTAQADSSSADSGNGSASNTGGYAVNTWYDMDWYSFIILDHAPMTAEENAQEVPRLEALRNQYRGLVMPGSHDTKWGHIYEISICDDNFDPIGKFIWE